MLRTGCISTLHPSKGAERSLALNSAGFASEILKFPERCYSAYRKRDGFENLRGMYEDRTLKLELESAGRTNGAHRANWRPPH